MIRSSSMNVFYHPNIIGQTIDLDETESKHAIRVLRLGKGDPVQIVDGRGGWYETVIEEAHPKRCLLRITAHTPDYQPLSYHLHLAVSPTKSIDRFEWFLEKATEIGISEITPLLCHRTERSRLNLERMERIVVSAMKQSLKAYRPNLNEPTGFSEFIKKKRAGVEGIAHCIDDTANSLKERHSIMNLPDQGSFTLMVGPEGDFTVEEVESALTAGFQPIQLGESRLRTETAAVYICTAFNLRFNN